MGVKLVGKLPFGHGKKAGALRLSYVPSSYPPAKGSPRRVVERALCAYGAKGVQPCQQPELQAGGFVPVVSLEPPLDFLDSRNKNVGNRAFIRGRQMEGYRLYCLDGEGHIGLAEWIEAETDEEAINQARQLRPDAHKCEIWLKTRLVAKLNGQGRLELVDHQSELMELGFRRR